MHGILEVMCVHERSTYALVLVSTCAAAAALLPVAPLHAAQAVWFDQEGEWPGGHLNRMAPSNMIAPNDFTSGPVYVRYESTEKPSNFNTRAQICVWQDGFSLESCSEFVTFSEEGVYYTQLPPPSQWWKKAPIDYSRAFQAFRLIHKQVDGGNRWIDTCGGSHCMGGSAAPHIPMRYHAEAIVTTAGHDFQPPADWTGCPADWGCDGSGSADTTRAGDNSSTSVTGADCSLVHPGSELPQGFGAPYDTLSQTRDLLVAVTCTGGGAALSVGAGKDTQYIYRLAYAWRGGGWQEVPLSGSALRGQAWYVGAAHAPLPHSASEMSQTQFVIAYICTWTPSTSSGQAGQWKCGCRDSTCAQGMWQLQAFRVGSGSAGQQGRGDAENSSDGLVGGLTKLARERPRILISTDATRCDFDDAHTMIMTLLFADLLRIEGVIVSPPNCGWPNNIDDALDAYEADYSKLAPYGDFPLPQELQGVYRDQGGENLIIEKAHEGSAEDPLWIGVWGSHTDVADALRKDPSIKSKIRLFGNGLGWNYEQDKSSRDYIWREHPDLYWIDVLTTELENNHLGDGLFRQHMNQTWYNENVRGAGALGALADRQGKGGNPPCVNCESAFGPRDIGQGVLYLLGNDVTDPRSPGWDGVYEKYEDGVHEDFWVYSDDPQFRADGYDSRIPFRQGMEEWVPMLEERFGWLK